jgi:hypothetical protein
VAETVSSTYLPVSSALGFSVASPVVVTAASYLVGAIVFAVGGYPNFPIWIVVSTILMFVGVPLVMLLRLRTQPEVKALPSRFGVLTGVFGGLALLVIHSSSLTLWSDYYSNFSYQRLDNGEGYHNDSAFHVAIIQGILRSGYPTVSQHFEPLIGYHTLSHFADALALQILNLDPWESYALLFFAKGAAVSVALIYFAAKVSRNQAPAVFYVVLFSTAVAVTSNWRIIGSHGEWLPFLILVLVAPSVATLLRQKAASLRWLLALTGFVVLLGLGKISLGFSFAAVVGFWLLLNQPRDFRIYLMGALWATFFFAFGSTFAAENRTLNFQRLGDSWPEISGITILVVVLFLVARSARSQVLRNGALAGTATFLIAVVLSVGALNSPTDAFYFFHGTFLTLFLLVTPSLMSVFRESELAMDPASTLPARRGLEVISFGATILLAAGPVFATAPYSPFRSWEAMAANLAQTNTVTFGPQNAADESGRTQSITKRLASLQTSSGERDGGFFLEMKREINRVVGLSKPGVDPPLLFLSREDFLWLSEESGSADSWSVSFLVVAITGLPLLHGVNSEGMRAYGFRDYGTDASQLTAEEAVDKNLCQFGRPVIVAVDLENLKFADLCGQTR